MEIVEENSQGSTYKTDNFQIYYRNKGATIEEQRFHNRKIYYLISGKLLLTIEANNEDYSAPATFAIPKQSYYLIEALTDIELIVFEEE